MGVISLEKSQCMYWLGRYAERVFTTLKTYTLYYDRMLDDHPDMYKSFCKKLGIQDIYGTQEVFNENYLFDRQDESSIVSSLQRTFDNAVVLRDEISSESLSYIHIAMDTLTAAQLSQERLIDLQQVMDELYAFWGSVDDCVESELCRNLMKCGRYQERLDLYVRLEYEKKEIERTYCKLKKRIEKAGLVYQTQQLESIGNYIAEEVPLRENRPRLLICLAQLFA